MNSMTNNLSSQFDSLLSLALTVGASIVVFLLFLSGIALILAKVKGIPLVQSSFDQRVATGVQTALVKEAISDRLAERQQEDESPKTCPTKRSTSNLERVSDDIGKVAYISSLIEENGNFAQKYFQGFDELSAEEQSQKFNDFHGAQMMDELKQHGYYTKKSFSDLSFEERLTIPKDRYLETYEDAERVLASIKYEEDPNVSPNLRRSFLETY